SRRAAGWTRPTRWRWRCVTWRRSGRCAWWNERTLVISILRGAVVSRQPVLVVDVGGVGFAVQVSARTAAELPPVSGRVALYTYLHVREDHLSLYGFGTEEERGLFVQLLDVQGVGPRVALTLLSSAPHEDLVRALQTGDEAFLVKLPGV